VAVAVVDLAPAALSGHDLFVPVLGVSAALGLGWVSVMAAKLLADAPR